jgi:hypothetical protein
MMQDSTLGALSYAASIKAFNAQEDEIEARCELLDEQFVLSVDGVSGKGWFITRMLSA